MDDKTHELIDFLANNKAYPVYRNKKVSFIGAKKDEFFEKIKPQIITQLNLNSNDACRKVRELIKERLSMRRKKPIKEWVKDERPREMLIKYGAENLPLAKLLAIILRTGDSLSNASAEDIGRRLLEKFKTLRGIDNAPIEQLCEIDGIGVAKATQIKACIEIGKRFYREKAEKRNRIKSPEDIIIYVSDYYASYLRDSTKEFFNVVLLDSRNKPIEGGNIELSKGSITGSIVDPKEIIKEATKRSASAIILVHNHPSGDTEPSDNDINATKKIVDACRLVGIRVLDHIIIGKNIEDYFSFIEEGLLK
jgi:DNA repair protein RadC